MSKALILLLIIILCTFIAGFASGMLFARRKAIISEVELIETDNGPTIRFTLPEGSENGLLKKRQVIFEIPKEIRKSHTF